MEYLIYILIMIVGGIIGFMIILFTLLLISLVRYLGG